MLPASVMVQCSAEVTHIVDAFTASNHFKNLPGKLKSYYLKSYSSIGKFKFN